MKSGGKLLTTKIAKKSELRVPGPEYRDQSSFHSGRDQHSRRARRELLTAKGAKKSCKGRKEERVASREYRVPSAQGKREAFNRKKRKEAPQRTQRKTLQPQRARRGNRFRHRDRVTAGAHIGKAHQIRSMTVMPGRSWRGLRARRRLSER